MKQTPVFSSSQHKDLVWKLALSVYPKSQRLNAQYRH